MIRFISKYFARPLSLFLSIYMINLSIDAAKDMEGSIFDPNENEIESAVELVLEVLMKQTDAFPEHDEPDPESETCLILLDHIIPTSDLFDLESKKCLTLKYPPVFRNLNYSDPTLTYRFPPPRLTT